MRPPPAPSPTTQPSGRRQYQIFIDRPPEAVFAFHASLKNLARLTPADAPDEPLGDWAAADATLAEGARGRIRTRRAGGVAAATLEVEVFEWDPPRGFAERQVSGPFASWVHRRRFAPFQSGTLMTDTIEYAALGGPLGAVADKMWLGKRLDEYFRHRQAEAKRLLETVGRIKGRGV